ncbi:MAG: long-chain acyl-CoA synthetase, partial [Thermoleophilaceae bacterium]|nr:long-chain acyl-CoA synthetase [Thermoleophilaceae bacterium]
MQRAVAGIDTLLERGAPATPLLSHGDHTLDRGALLAAADGIATRLARMPGGVEGRRVAVVAPNVPALVVGMFAAWRAGAAAVPLSARLRDYELRRILADAEASAIVCVDRHAGFSFADALEGLAAAVPSLRLALVVDALGEVTDEVGFGDHGPAAEPLGRDDIAAVLYTSGTTGEPKGALVRHATELHCAAEMRAAIGL